MNRHTAIAAALAAGGTLLASVAVAAPATAHMRGGSDSPRATAHVTPSADHPVEDCPAHEHGPARPGDRPDGHGARNEDARRGVSGPSGPQRQGRGSGPGTSRDRVALPDADPAGLTDEQAAYLTYLVQEEKMARDLYREFATVYGARIFTMIATSEQQHMDAVSFLLDRYGIDDPTDTLDAGQFTDADLQALFDTLLTQGAASVDDALAVGVTVEETDLADLADAVDMPADVTATLDRLTEGSERHLAAFTR